MTLEGCHTSSTYSVLFDHSGERIFTANEDNKIKVWSTENGILIHTLRALYGGIVDMVINKENDLLAVACGDYNICIFNIQNYTKITHFQLVSDCFYLSLLSN